jgi:hypothetical protein
MAKDPAVLFYTSDFLSGTFTMDYEQKGKYITLLCIQHQKGFLTEKDLRAVLQDTDIEIFDKFNLSDDGLYYNIKMKECAEKRKAYSESRRNNRKNKDNNISSTYVNDMNNISKSYVKHMETGTGNETVNINTVQEYTSADIKLMDRYLTEVVDCIDANNMNEAIKKIKLIIEDYGSYELPISLVYTDPIAQSKWISLFQQYYLVI